MCDMQKVVWVLKTGVREGAKLGKNYVAGNVQLQFLSLFCDMFFQVVHLFTGQFSFQRLNLVYGCVGRGALKSMFRLLGWIYT